MAFSKVGPNQSMGWSQFKVSKSPVMTCFVNTLHQCLELFVCQVMF
jgi:hypothetical protein